MRSKIIKIGNSQGVRIPKTLLEQSGLAGEVELEVKTQQIIIRKPQKARENWSEKFQKMADTDDDLLLDAEVIVKQNKWDYEEWTW